MGVGAPATQLASSVSVVLAMMIAPASRRFFVERRFVGRQEAVKGERAAGGGMSVRQDVVLERDGNAVQRAADLALRALAIALVGFVQRVGIDGDDGVQLAVVARDAQQVLGDDLARGDAALLHRRLHFGDGGFDDLEWPARRGSLGLS